MSELKTLDELPESRSFTSLATISLANPHILHPNACNPAMDLVALLHERGGEDDPSGAVGKAYDAKGKGKAGDEIATTVVLWRLTGSKVWEVEVAGRVAGLGWSADGLYLTLVVLRFNPWPRGDEARPSAHRSSIEHLSVHTGDVVKAVPLPRRLVDNITPADWGLNRASERYQWWPVVWESTKEEWETSVPGSSLTIIDSLPKVTPVEPPKPAILNPFALQTADKKSDKGVHAKLNRSAALLPASSPLPPNVLAVSATPVGMNPPEHLLTGTFLLPFGTPRPLSLSILGLAQRADRLTLLLDVVARGCESSQAVIKDGEKQTFLWRDELEICGEQQGMSVSDVHADLFKFLMTGRGGAAVTEWLGNRLANRAVTKWESTLHTEFTTIQNILSQSMAPSLERILLILEELSGWPSEWMDCDLILDSGAIDRAREICRGLLMLTEEMRKEATLEWTAAMEWFKWIRYEMARSVSDEGGPVAAYDLKLVWSFMKNGFVSSRFKTHFPDDPTAKDDVLPSTAISKPASQPQDLDKVMASTMTMLLARPGASESIGSPTTLRDYSFSPTRVSPVTTRSPQVASSPDTVGGASVAREEETVERHPDREPWAWVNTLIAACNDIVGSMRPREEVVPTLSTGPEHARREIDGAEWALVQSPQGLLVQTSTPSHTHSVQGQARFAIAGAEILQVGFFDDHEVVVIFEHNGQRYLSAIQIEILRERLSSPADDLPLQELPISRARPIGNARPGGTSAWQLALNGNAGRRSGWVLTQGGTELEVFDMEGNEDDEEGEEGEDEVDMQTD